MKPFQRRSAVLLIGLSAMWGAVAFAEENEASNQDEAVAAGTIEDPINDRVLGDEDAPITIVEYASFTCSHCRDFEETVLPKVQEKYIDTGKAKLVYREVYFDGAGLLAASLARCVPEEQYFPMAFTLYDQYDSWLKDQTDMAGVVTELTQLGVLAGLGKDKIAACLDDRAAQESMIANSQKNMEADDVRGTPTLIIDGEVVRDWAWENLEPLLDKKLEEAG